MCPDCGCGDSYDHHSWCPLKRRQEIQADKDKVRTLELELLRYGTTINTLRTQLAAAEKRAESLREALQEIATDAAEQADADDIHGGRLNEGAAYALREIVKEIQDAIAAAARKGTSPAPDSGDAERAAREWLEWWGRQRLPMNPVANESLLNSLAALLRERDRALITAVGAWLRNHAADDFFFSPTDGTYDDMEALADALETGKWKL